MCTDTNLEARLQWRRKTHLRHPDRPSRSSARVPSRDRSLGDYPALIDKLELWRFPTCPGQMTHIPESHLSPFWTCIFKHLPHLTAHTTPVPSCFLAVDLVLVELTLACTLPLSNSASRGKRLMSFSPRYSSKDETNASMQVTWHQAVAVRCSWVRGRRIQSGPLGCPLSLQTHLNETELVIFSPSNSITSDSWFVPVSHPQSDIVISPSPPHFPCHKWDLVILHLGNWCDLWGELPTSSPFLPAYLHIGDTYLPKIYGDDVPLLLKILPGSPVPTEWSSNAFTCHSRFSNDLVPTCFCCFISEHLPTRTLPSFPTELSLFLSIQVQYPLLSGQNQSLHSQHLYNTNFLS